VNYSRLRVQQTVKQITAGKHLAWAMAKADGGSTQRIYGNRVFLNLGSRERMLGVPGLAEAHPMTH